MRACSSAGLERTPDKREVGGSSPPRPTKSNIGGRLKAEGKERFLTLSFFSIFHLIRGYSSAGRAPALHAGGQRFDPVYLHHRIKDLVLRVRFNVVESNL